jgi:signal transduction histidine kinase
MQLSLFIESRMEDILQDWQVFARRNAPDLAAMTDLALRDHAREILGAVALDLRSPQSDAEQFTKSQGDADDAGGPRTAAAIHGALRQGSDFSLLQLSAEFRALRATVLRQWLPTVGEVTESAMDDMVRFNEAIDQALAQSIVAYSERAGLARDLFLAVLGHDLRSPLANVAMIDDLLSYTRVQMGRGIPTAPMDCDMTDVLHAAVADASATYPKARFEIALSGDLRGHVDPIRLQQLLTNLLVNAAQHGNSGRPVQVEAHADGEAIVVRVTNHGRPVAPEDCERIFRPLVQLPEADSRSTSLGLGLYIAREIALAHAGSIGVTSSAGAGTVFETRLPRGVAPPRPAAA